MNVFQGNTMRWLASLTAFALLTAPTVATQNPTADPPAPSVLATGIAVPNVTVDAPKSFDDWLADRAGRHGDELLSVLSAADHLPERTSRDPDDIAVRAREKEVIKRRLAAVTDASAEVAAYVRASVTALNGVPHLSSRCHRYQTSPRRGLKLGRTTNEEYFRASLTSRASQRRPHFSRRPIR